MFLSDEEKSTLTLSLKNGLGLTECSMIINKTPKQLSEIIKGDNKLFHECQMAIRYYSQNMLLLASQSLSKGKLLDWSKKTKELKTSVPRLVFWEEMSTKSKTTKEIVVKAAMFYKDFIEIATAIGMTEEELYDFIVEHDELDRYFADEALF